MSKTDEQLMDEFIENYPFFQYYENYSYILCEDISQILVGLGLPTYKGKKRNLWGYQDHPTHNNILVPIERDLKILYKAAEMYQSGRYYTTDILEWIEKAKPTRELQKASFHYILQTRRMYIEGLEPLEKRIKYALYGFLSTPPAPEEKADAKTKGANTETSEDAEKEDRRAVSGEKRRIKVKKKNKDPFTRKRGRPRSI